MLSGRSSFLSVANAFFGLVEDYNSNGTGRIGASMTENPTVMPQGNRSVDLPEQIVTEPSELVRCCEHLTGCGQFGFDTEFVGEETYHPRLCLIQVATAERRYLIDPLVVGLLDAFWGVLLNPEHTVVVHAGREEVRLCRLWTGQTPRHFFDLQIAAGLVGLSYPLSHAALVNQLLGVQLPKAETLTEWRSRPLTPQQIRYAFDDVRYLLPLWERLDRQLRKLNRLQWAQEEFARLAAHATPEEPEQAKWRKLRGLGSLSRRQLAIVRELFVWREARAADLNRPPRTIVRDDLLIEIARRNPSRERDLQVIRGLPRRDLSAILETVSRARDIPADEWPPAAERAQDPPQVGWATNILTAVLGNFCARHYLAANLAASNADLKLLAKARFRGEPPPEDSLLTKGWRSQHVLPELLAVLEGRRSVCISDLRAAAPLKLGDA
jgi:ribonuclease D